MKKIWMSFLLLHCLASPVEAAYVVMSHGEVIAGVDEHEIQSVASISKIMTALLAIERSELNDLVVVDKEATLQEGSSIYVKENQRYTILSLLFGLMMRSGNDAAYLLAKHVSGSVEAFAQLMNERALEIGMSRTLFRNPSGLDELDGGNLSTCYDMALLMEEAMKNEVFRMIVSTPHYQNEYQNLWHNKNKLLYEYSLANGGKTGYTLLAGKTLVTSANDGQSENVVVSFRESRYFSLHVELHERVFRSFDIYKILDAGTYWVRGKKVRVLEDVYLFQKKQSPICIEVQMQKNSMKILYENYNAQKQLIYEMEEAT